MFVFFFFWKGVNREQIFVLHSGGCRMWVGKLKMLDIYWQGKGWRAVILACQDTSLEELSRAPHFASILFRALPKVVSPLVPNFRMQV